MELPNRKYPRLKTFDYAGGGAFFVTICTRNKEKVLGNVPDGEEACVNLTQLGKTVKTAILNIPNKYWGVILLLNSVVMPNHIHLLLQISEDAQVSLLRIVRSFKTVVTKSWGQPVWQRSFYEHIIRNEQDALHCWKYIDENPKKWTLDKYYE